MNASDNGNVMPIWITDSQIDPTWIAEKMPIFSNVSECIVKDISNDTRKGDKIKNGATLLVQMISKENNPISNVQTLVVKQIPSTGLGLSKNLGLAREAIFYNELAPKIKVQSNYDNGNDDDEGSNKKNMSALCVPKIYYATGDMIDGSKIVFMEDLSEGFIDSGILFGPGNPNNWKRDLQAKIEEAYPQSSSSFPPTSFEVANETFLAIAEIHARFWRDSELLDEKYSWLRGSSWISGRSESSWRASQGMLQQMWTNTANDIDSRIQWDPLVKKILEKAMKNISWELQLQRLNEGTHFCLVHGDFWPGNVMISKNSIGNLRLLDWEMVGLGSGPQDLGQYIISNMDPCERRECEEKLIRNYYSKLVRLGVQNLSWEECWREYTIGGLERWLWFLVYFCAQSGPMLKWAQFFHDQIKEFVHDHNIQPEDITQPRP